MQIASKAEKRSYIRRSISNVKKFLTKSILDLQSCRGYLLKVSNQNKKPT